MNNNPIGIFDSGLGGISVLREMKKILPCENYIYMGDSKNAPYGTKRTSEVYELSKHWVEYFLERNAKAIVIACNTATSAAAARLRKLYTDIPIIGLEPALKPAATKYADTGKKILVLATELTLREDKFQHLLHQYSDKAEILLLPAPGIVELVEADKADSEEMLSYIENLLSPYIVKNISGVVLGCTHFPFAKWAIKKVLGENVEFFDGAEGAAREVLHQLKLHDTLSSSTTPGTIKLLNSSDDPTKIDLSQRLLNTVE